MPLHIDGPQFGTLSKAIQSACPTPKVLREVLKTKLDDDIWNFAGLDDEYPDIRHKLIQSYNARWHIDRLVVALLEHAPDNGLVLEFAWKSGIVSRTTGDAGKAPDGNSLERMLDPNRGFSDPMAFLRRFGQIVNWVCRISVRQAEGTGYGTGLLIGPNVVLTNYHVVEPLIKQDGSECDRNGVKVQFDYRSGPDGVTITEGVACRLVDSDEWLIDSSPYHRDDLRARSVAENLAASRPADALDYALLRLDRDLGNQPPGEKPSEGAPLRGWAKLPDEGQDFSKDFGKDAAVFIFQHPQAEPLRLDWEKPAILGVNANQTRVLYNVNTKGGSSGSPCFNAKLELIALHHAGGKDWPADGNYLYNQGIPVGQIRSLLQQRNKLAALR